ncbi:MAG: HAMP domain-containing histidine kinase, partial [Planctomycetaceae bacterium]|nr:HAMP domain-containing histidine kinase [Planctomycetaceae bacterium]
PRLDHDIVVRFRHRSLLRVFIPMITAADNRVIGTVETGYQRKYREYIYEKDIQILQEFIDYAVHALEQRKKGLLDQISHEFRAPIVGIRSNASFLRRRFPELKSSLIRRKFSDILADSELLLYQVKELEYILGRTPPVSKRERTFLFRDVIIKTIKQLKPLVAEASLNISNIEYDSADVFKIGPLYIDKSKINQVVYNLLMNSIKYAEEDADQFKIRISVDKSGEMYVIQFKDWGIGIRPELKEKIFEDGFRAPEAMRKNVSGSGLGLTISQKIMRELGGDLRLTHYSKPTVFQILLPTKLEEIPNDPIRR